MTEQDISAENFIKQFWIEILFMSDAVFVNDASVMSKMSVPTTSYLRRMRRYFLV